MKRYSHPIAILAVLAATVYFLLGCTLSMEEWNLPEEERGFDEPYTEETPFGDVTYQFNDDVIHLTDNLQDDYLLKVENDSILYISGDIPKAYRPQKGLKLHAGFGYNFPRALNAEIVSVQDVGGIYKVVTRNISRDDVFKELSYCFDYEGSVDNIMLLQTLDDETLEDLGYQRMADSTLIDWNVFDSVQAAHGSEKAKARIQRRARTRAVEIADEINSKKTLSWTLSTDELLVVNTVNDMEIKDWHNTGKGIATMISDIKSFKNYWDDYSNAVVPKKWWNKFNPYAKLDFQMTHFIHSHSERNKAEDYEINWNETWDEIDIAVDAGFTYKGQDEAAPAEDDSDKRGTFVEWMTKPRNQQSPMVTALINEMNAANAKASLSRKKSKLPLKGFEAHKYWPICSWFAINFVAEGTPKLEFAGAFTIAGKITTAKRKSGKHTHDDKVFDIDEQTAPATSHFTQIGGNVELSLGYSVRAGADFLICQAAGPSIGANVDASLTFKAGLDIYNAEKENKSQWFKPNGSVTFKIDFFCDFKFVVKPLGFSLWETPIKDFPDPHVHIYYWSTKFAPEVKFGPTTYRYEDGLFVATTCYSFENLGGFSSLLGNDVYPMLKMYKGPISKNDFVFMTPAISYGKFDAQSSSVWPKASKGEEYDFFYTGPMDVSVNEVHLVPCMVTFSEDIKASWANYRWPDLTTTYLGEKLLEVDNDYPLAIGPPYIYSLKSQQIFGDSNEFDFSQSGEFINSQGGNSSSSGGMSIDASKLSLFKFLTQVRIFNAVRMQSCGLKVIIYNQYRQRIKAVDIPIGNPVTGVYTFVFSFVTDWIPEEWDTYHATSERLYYRVIPYWTDNTIGEREEATDDDARKYHPIEYRIDEVQINEDDKAKWGTVMPEKEIN